MKKQYIMFLIIILAFSPVKAYGIDMNLSGESYILMEESSGRIILEKNSNKRMPMASTTKIMTALIALEEGNLESLVTIDQESIGIEGSSLYLKKDEILSLKDLLYGLMLRSGNDSAVAIANHISKNEEEFIKKMNSKARLINANNTNFTNPHGLSHVDHYSTAYDLALITREALKIEEFLNISKAKSYTAKRDVDGYFLNKNKTLWEYEGGDGVKIGYTINSGRCLVSTATRDNMRLIAVSLNARDWFNDNYKLLDYGFDNYKQYVIYDKNQFITSIMPDNGDEFISLITEEELIYPLKEEEKEKIKIIVYNDDSINLPIKKGDVLGEINVYLDGILIRKDNLIAKTTLEKRKFWDILFNRKTS